MQADSQGSVRLPAVSARVSEDDSHPDPDGNGDVIADAAEIARRLRDEMRIATGRLRSALSVGARTTADATSQDDGTMTPG
jgi:hypothetical protein